MIIAQYKQINWTYWMSIGVHHDVDSILEQIQLEYIVEEVEPGLYVLYGTGGRRHHCRLYDLATSKVIIKESPWKVGLNDCRTL